MARMVKFPLKMKDDVQVRDISALRENFDVEKIVGYFLDGSLKRWLVAWYYDEELEKVSELNKEDTLLAKKLCGIFGMEYVGDIIDTENIVERNARISRLKQYTDDEDIINNVDSVAFNQEELVELYEKEIEKIYLCEGEFKIPEIKKSIEYEMIGEVYVEGLDDTEKKATLEISNSNIYISNILPELADLIYDKKYVELEDYVVWTEHGLESLSERKQYKKYFKGKKSGDMSKRFKAWNKNTDEYFSFEIPSVLLSTYVNDFISFKNKILIIDNLRHTYLYDIENCQIERINYTISIRTTMCVLDSGKYFYYDNEVGYALYDISTKTREQINIQGINDCFYSESKMFFNKNDRIYMYDNNSEDTQLYKLDKSEYNLSDRMEYYDEELFVLLGTYTKRLIGIKLDGTVNEYFKMPDANTMFLKRNLATLEKSQYMVFEKGNDIIVFDMQTKTMEVHKNCTLISSTRRVGNYLYIYPQSDFRHYRVDLKNGWNPILIEEDK